jgi:hypothetical protein
MRAAARSVTRMAVSLVLIASGMRAAQLTGTLSGPVVGYVFDRNAGNLRPVKGILGSATVGAPVETGFAISQALTLDASHVIVSRDAELLALSLDAGQISPLAIPGLPANPTRAAASVQATAAAFYYADANEVRIVTGLPQEPRYTGLLQVDRPLTRMAVNNDGTLLVYATDEPDGNVLYSWTASSGSARFVTSATSVSGIAITRNGDAVVTDRDANEVFAIWDAAGGAIRRPLADVSQGVASPIGVVSSENRILVANTGSTATVLDATGRFLKTLHCDCTISGVYPLRNSVFRLTDGVDQTLYLLDASSAEERILFVPPPQE